LRVHSAGLRILVGKNEQMPKGHIVNFVLNRRLSPLGHFHFYGRVKLFLKIRSPRRRFLEQALKHLRKYILQRFCSEFAYTH